EHRQIKYRNNVIECDHGKLKRIIGATLEHRQIKYRNNVIECDHGKLKRIIGATLGFKSMKTAYATIKGIEVMRALRKGQASAFYYGDPLGEMRLVSRVFEM
uniref:DDE-type integrase/transposase/recombinase n=1 Tax=Klebsiella pneumoniae TaxID=573 RepID=UPI00237F3E8D